MADTDLAISVLDTDGSVAYRWGPDEGAVANIPKGLGFTTSDPGGFKDATVALSRRIDTDWPDLNLLRDLRIYGLGNRTAWEGRFQELPQHHAEDYSITPGAVGHAAALDDDPSFAEIYIDRDITKWGEPSIARKLILLGALIFGDGCDISAGIQGAGGQALTFAYSALRKFYRGGELWYYGNGVDIGALNFIFRGSGADEAWYQVATLPADESNAVRVGETGDFNGNAGPVESGCAASAAGGKYAVVSCWRGQGEGEIDPYGGVTRWEHPIVRGRHGLPVRGTTVPTWGLYASDVIADIVKRCAPGLTFTTGAGGSIEPSTYSIPHLDFSTPGKGSDALLAVNAYHQRSWGVEDDKRFFWRSTQTYRRRWKIRRSMGHGVDLLGPQAEDAVNGVVVTFTDAAGRTRVLTPPGVSNAYATSALLQDTSPTNPVNAAGIARKWGVLSLGFVTDVAGATQVGNAWLAEKLRSATSRGSVTVTGMVEDFETGALYPAWFMRAGDSAIVTDGDNIERRIIETSYSHDSLTTTCNMDSTPHKVDALMERMGIALMGFVE